MRQGNPPFRGDRPRKPGLRDALLQPGVPGEASCPKRRGGRLVGGPQLLGSLHRSSRTARRGGPTGPSHPPRFTLQGPGPFGPSSFANRNTRGQADGIRIDRGVRQRNRKPAPAGRRCALRQHLPRSRATPGCRPSRGRPARRGCQRPAAPGRRIPLIRFGLQARPAADAAAPMKAGPNAMARLRVSSRKPEPRTPVADSILISHGS